MTIKELYKMGFIYKKLTKHWYLVRLYANKKHPLHRIVIPIFITDKKNKE